MDDALQIVNVSMLGTALFLAAINTAVGEYLKAPMMRKFPTLDLWWYQYVTLLTGVLLAVIFQVSVFSMENMWAGIMLTGLLVGGGSKLLYEVFDQFTGISA